MADNTPRFLVVQDRGINGDALLRASDTVGTPDNEQAGLAIQQPPQESTLVGDIRPALSGEPEVQTKGQLGITGAGAEGNMRWGFVRDEDDDTTDLQFRQLPTVAGRRADVLHHNSSSPAEFVWSPTLIPLVNGSLLLLFMEQDAPFTTSGAWATTFKFATLNPEGDVWDNPANTSGLGEFEVIGSTISNGPYWRAVDAIQYPDNGEIIAMVAGGYADSSAFDEPLMACYSSTDNGLTWEMKSRLLFQGNNGIVGTLALNTGMLQAVACERTRSGRLVVIAGNALFLWAFTSDDRGRSWASQELAAYSLTYESGDTSPSPGLLHQALSMRRMRNGTLLAFQARSAIKIAGGLPAEPVVWMTTDGISWQGQDSTVGNVRTHPDVAVVERPDGYPMVYTVAHDIYTSFGITPQQVDELGVYVILKRDPEPSDVPDDDLILDKCVRDWHLLVQAGALGVGRPNAPTGELNIQTPAPVLDGFSAIAAANWRGHVVVAAVNQNQPDNEVGLIILRTDHFEPLQEQLEPLNFDTLGSITRDITGMGATWDCYGSPENWGYGLVSSGGTGAIVAPNADGGYWSSSVAAVRRYWQETALPYPFQNFNGYAKFVLQPISGGSTTSDEMICWMELSDGSNEAGAYVAIEVSGSNYLLQLFDIFGGVAIGPTLKLTDAVGQYIEIKIAMWQPGTPSSDVEVSAWARAQDRDADPDWLAPYEEIHSDVLTLGTGTESVIFGHKNASSTASARWKSVAIWRNGGNSGGQYDTTPLVQRGIDYADDDANIRTNRAEYVGPADSGADNWMRTAQGISHPAQFFHRGLHVEWRGEAAVEGAVDYSSQYVFGAHHLLDQTTPQREWRSINTGSQIELILDAEQVLGTGALFNPRAIGIIGRNFPSFSIQMNSADSWGAPSFDISAGIPGMLGAPYTRSTHLLHFSASGVLTMGAFRLRVTPSSAAPSRTFRPHRFKSRPNGPRFYAAFVDNPSGGQTSVFEIDDNDGDTLYFKSNIANTLNTPTEVAIFSDRFAWDFTAHAPAGNTGFRYLRLVLDDVDHQDDDASFYRAGVLVLGQPTEIQPGARWGFQRTSQPGASINLGLTGAATSRRNHGEIRSWQIDSPVLLPPNEPLTQANMDLGQAVASWRKVTDATRRLEANGEPAILAFDGNRFAGSLSSSGQLLLTDPYDLALIRVANVGTVSHEAYWCESIEALGGGTEKVPREVSQVRGITFTEQL